MKYLTLFVLLILGCTSNATTDSKPDGVQVLTSLLDASNSILDAEPLCNMQSVSTSKVPYTLKDHLSVVLSSSYESENKTNIQTTCNTSKHDTDKNQVIDIWDCTLIVNEISSTGEFISSSTIAFGLTKTDFKFVSKSLRCF